LYIDFIYQIYKNYIKIRYLSPPLEGQGEASPLEGQGEASPLEGQGEAKFCETIYPPVQAF
jgi:hypothetical protein